MKKSTTISMLFFLIFLLGILGVVTLVNESLNGTTLIEVHFPSTSETANADQDFQSFLDYP